MRREAGRYKLARIMYGSGHGCCLPAAVLSQSDGPMLKGGCAFARDRYCPVHGDRAGGVRPAAAAHELLRARLQRGAHRHHVLLPAGHPQVEHAPHLLLSAVFESVQGCAPAGVHLQHCSIRSCALLGALLSAVCSIAQPAHTSTCSQGTEPMLDSNAWSSNSLQAADPAAERDPGARAAGRPQRAGGGGRRRLLPRVPPQRRQEPAQ